MWSRLFRLPRILAALLIGAGLAISGAALQGLFRNPLVDPSIIGVTAGAGFGGTLAILLVGGGYPVAGRRLCLRHGQHAGGAGSWPASRGAPRP